MWHCRVCNVEFVLESVEEHLYRNHMLPVVGVVKVYNCGDCLFNAEGFQLFAIHCIQQGHKPTKVNKGLQYDDYVSQLFVALEEAMDLSAALDTATQQQQLSSTASSASTLEPTISYECNDISWMSSSSNSSAQRDGKEGKTGGSIPFSADQGGGPSISINPLPPLSSSRKENAGNHPLAADGILARPDGPTLTDEELEAFFSSGEDNMSMLKHPVSNLKLYACPYCPKAFTRSRTLRYHISSHTKEKLFECETCGRTFSYRNVLANHERTHSGEKPFKCDQCDKTFTNAGSLRYHCRKGHNCPPEPKKHPLIIVPTLPPPGHILTKGNKSANPQPAMKSINSLNTNSNIPPSVQHKVVGHKTELKEETKPETEMAETKQEDCA